MDDSTILWDFYPGAYGPSILVELPDLAAVALLRRILVRVAATGSPIDLNNEPRMRLKNIANLKLVLATQPSRKTLSSTGDPLFVWSCTAEQWRAHAALLDPFLDGHVGHQYLSAEGVDDALIEVSFGEHHP